MKKRVVILATLILAAVLVTVALADDEPVFPIDDYKFVSPLKVGTVRFFPNEPGAPDAEIDKMCDGSVEDGLDCWEYFPEGYLQRFNVGDEALHGQNVIIQGEYQNISYQAIQCWLPGDLAGWRNFQLWSSYRVFSGESGGWPICSWSRALFVEWVEEEQAWYRLTEDIWELTRMDVHDHWTTIQTYLPGMEALDDNYVCFLIEAYSCGLPAGSEFWFDEFVLAVDHDYDWDNVIRIPIVMKNSHYIALAAVNQVASVPFTVRQ